MKKWLIAIVVTLVFIVMGQTVQLALLVKVAVDTAAVGAGESEASGQKTANATTGKSGNKADSSKENKPGTTEVGKGSGEETPTESPEKGIFVRSDGTVRDGCGDDIISFHVYTENGHFSIPVPVTAEVTKQAETVLEYILKNEWMTVSFLYEIDGSITTAEDTERKINAITADFPITMDKNSLEYKNLQENFLYNGQWSPGQKNDIHSVWLKKVETNGATYFLEECDYSKDDFSDISLSILCIESYNCFDGITVHEQIKVENFDLFEYYAGLDTEIGKKQARREWTSITEHIQNTSMWWWKNDSWSAERVASGNRMFTSCWRWYAAIYGINLEY